MIWNYTEKAKLTMIKFNQKQIIDYLSKNFNCEPDNLELEKERLKLLIDDIGYEGILTSIPSAIFPENCNLFRYSNDYFRLYDMYIVFDRLDLIQLCESYKSDKVHYSLINLNLPSNPLATFKQQSLIEIARNLYPSLCIFGKMLSILYILKFTNFSLICIKFPHNQIIFLWLKSRLKIQLLS